MLQSSKALSTAVSAVSVVSVLAAVAAVPVVDAMAAPGSIVTTADTGVRADGSWDGTATLGPSTLDVRLVVESLDDTLRAGLDLPEMGELGMPFRVVRWEADGVDLELRTHLGLDRIEGWIAGETLHAVWTSPVMPDTARLQLSWSETRPGGTGSDSWSRAHPARSDRAKRPGSS